MAKFSISRTTTLYRSLLSTPPLPLHHHRHIPLRFCTTTSLPDSDDADSAAPSPSPEQTERTFFDRPLENGLDPGVYRVIQFPIMISFLFVIIIEIEIVFCVCVGDFGR